MPLTLIESNPTFKKEVEKSQPHLKVAEMFSRTIQGEGISTGIPSVFLRLKDCTLNCFWCDSASVWKFGNPYTIDEILNLLNHNGTVEEFRRGHHWIFTGGSPLLQQDGLLLLVEEFKRRFGFKPFIEIENECVLEPSLSFIEIVDQWNNSPKTHNSSMKERIRYKPELIKRIAQLPNSWFKFVIDTDDDWSEIDEYFRPLMRDDQIILMPCGANQEELSRTKEFVVEMAIKHNVRFSDREHINIWNKKTGV